MNKTQWIANAEVATQALDAINTLRITKDKERRSWVKPEPLTNETRNLMFDLLFDSVMLEQVQNGNIILNEKDGEVIFTKA